MPLAVRYPRRLRAGTRIATPVSTAGVYATALDLAGVAVPKTPHVGSLVAAVESKRARPPVVAEQLERGGGRGRAYRSDTLKLVQRVPDGVQLFDVAKDPAEADDLAPTRAADVARLGAELDAWRAALAIPSLDASIGRGDPPPLDAAAREKLRALGYPQ